MLPENNKNNTLQVEIPQQYAWVVLGVAFVALFYFICKAVNFIISKYNKWGERKFENRFVKNVTNTEFTSPTGVWGFFWGYFGLKFTASSLLVFGFYPIKIGFPIFA